MISPFRRYVNDSLHTPLGIPLVRFRKEDMLKIALIVFSVQITLPLLGLGAFLGLALSTRLIKWYLYEVKPFAQAHSPQAVHYLSRVERQLTTHSTTFHGPLSALVRVYSAFNFSGMVEAAKASNSVDDLVLHLATNPIYDPQDYDQALFEMAPCINLKEENS